jgi:hypothetical protein
VQWGSAGGQGTMGAYSCLRNGKQRCGAGLRMVLKPLEKLQILLRVSPSFVHWNLSGLFLKPLKDWLMGQRILKVKYDGNPQNTENKIENSHKFQQKN